MVQMRQGTKAGKDPYQCQFNAWGKSGYREMQKVPCMFFSAILTSIYELWQHVLRKDKSGGRNHFENLKLDYKGKEPFRKRKRKCSERNHFEKKAAY